MASKNKEGEPLEASLKRLTIRRTQRRQAHHRNEDRFFISDEQASARWRDHESQVRIVNLSSNGLMIETSRQANIGECVKLQLSGCNPISCSVRWIRDGRIGLDFADETEILDESGVQDYLFEAISAALGGASTITGRRVGRERRSRQARHGLVWVGSITIGPHTCPARLRNISSSGAMVAISARLGDVVGDRVLLELGKAGSANGLIRWASDFELGIEFAMPFDVSGLAQQPAAPAEALESDADDDGNDELQIGHYRRDRPDVKPHQPPDMVYGRLTLEEVYATLYPNGQPQPQVAPSADSA